LRLVEEIYIRAEEDTICQSCGVDILKGSNHLLETYVHQGKLLPNHYCLNKKCNPPNNVRLNFVRFGMLLVAGLVAYYFLFTDSSPIT